MQASFNGFVSGLGIALLAFAFQIVYVPTRIFYLGLAGIYSVAPFITRAILERDGGWVVAIGSTLLTAIGLSLLCEWMNHARLSRQNAASGAHFVSSLGVYIVLVQGVVMMWGNDTKILRAELDVTTHWGQFIITGAQCTTLVTAISLLSCMGFFLARSQVGLRIRALSDNADLFSLFGYNIEHYRLIAFGLAGFFATISALVTANETGFDPYFGLHAVLLAVVAVIIGGRYSFTGPVFGALLLGVLRAQVVWIWSARWQEAITFGLLALILLLRPQGLVTRQTRLETAP